MPPNTNSRSYDEASYHTMEASVDQLINATPYVDLEVAHTDLFEGAFKVVTAVFPSWQREHIKFVQCKDGITNQLVRATHLPSDFTVLVRAYGKGSDRIIDRRQEMINMITLSSENLCPPLYARFKNGLVYGFIKGRVSSVEDLGQPEQAHWIAKRLGKWHKVKLPQADCQACNGQKLWTTMRQWLSQVPAKYQNPRSQHTFAKRFDMKKIASELDWLIKRLEVLGSPIVFSHNDLLYGNIILDDQKGEASFIDYEYGCYASRGFDIGNHFNEFAGFECDYSRYPTKEFQLQWFEWYLTEYNSGVAPSIEDLETLYHEVNGFSLASHFYWGLWALVQAMVSDIDFDYMNYAVLRFDEYEKRKQQVIPTL
ncbi:kinase-like domain-containing protein [Radiomyces spectabilis]|uniref:kinase-like domain-containing protein n=1 Tax=Radiomyces spectabilis TaxID=64574 RepID=UPI00221EE542|nr:kinase-like domain-containing protein [Radiomyces spectabilis]KAI8380906.1 kinase-like domain-containing protein [Radiomyces spectabilis]